MIKLKNMSFLEKHIEKIVISVGVVFFLLVMWLYVSGEPYQVTIKGRGVEQSMSPDQVEVKIREKAKSLESAYSNPELAVPPVALPSWTQDFRNRMTAPLLPVDRLATTWNQPGLDEKIVQFVPTEVLPRVVPLPPAPTNIIPQADYAVLPPSGPAGFNDAAFTNNLNPRAAPIPTPEQLFKFTNNSGEPRDVKYVSVGATFDMERWRERLKGRNAAPDQRLPEDWWRGRLFVTDVLLERQEQNPVTGQWGPAQEVPIFNAKSHQFRDVQINFTAAEIPPLLDAIREAQERIVHPPFVDLERGIWTPPGTQQWLTPQQAARLVDIQTRLSKLRQTNNPALGGAPARPQVDRFGNEIPVIPEEMDVAAYDIQTQIAELEAARDEILGIVRATPTSGISDEEAAYLEAERISEAERLRREQTGRGGRAGIRQPFGTRGDPRLANPRAVTSVDGGTAAPALPAIKLWAHDLTVEPGKTYRYRITVSLVNPLFQISDVPRDQQAENFNKLSIKSEPSVWSAPVAVDPLLYYFMTGQDPSRKQVAVDVFRVFNGLWVNQSFDVRPGDPIGRKVELTYQTMRMPVDFNTQTMAVDIAFPAGQGNSGASSALIYNLMNNTMETRVLDQDIRDRTYQRLLQEKQIRAALLGG